MKRKFVPTKIAVGVDRVNIKDFNSGTYPEEGHGWNGRYGKAQVGLTCHWNTLRIVRR